MKDFINRCDEYHSNLGERVVLLFSAKVKTKFIKKIVCVGDEVLVATGLLGRGHPWTIRKCTIADLGTVTCRIYDSERFIGRSKGNDWIRYELILDIFRAGRLMDIPKHPDIKDQFDFRDYAYAKWADMPEKMPPTMK